MSYLTEIFGVIPWILYTGLKLLNRFCMSVSLFFASLYSAKLSLVTCEFLFFSGVNFETSGLVIQHVQVKILKNTFSSRNVFPLAMKSAKKIQTIVRFSVAMLDHKFQL